jgi:hypothetical protein
MQLFAIDSSSDPALLWSRAAVPAAVQRHLKQQSAVNTLIPFDKLALHVMLVDTFPPIIVVASGFACVQARICSPCLLLLPLPSPPLVPLQLAGPAAPDAGEESGSDYDEDEEEQPQQQPAGKAGRPASAAAAAPQQRGKESLLVQVRPALCLGLWLAAACGLHQLQLAGPFQLQ